MNRQLLSPLLCAALVLPSCALPHKNGDDSKVIYALPPRQPGTTPLTHTMSPVGGPFSFSRDRYVLNDTQVQNLGRLSPQWVKDKTRLMVVGFAQRGLPPDYARVLAHRRAESVRQVLISQGLDAANIHSTGYGNDMPGLGNDDSVVIYELKQP